MEPAKTNIFCVRRLVVILVAVLGSPESADTTIEPVTTSLKRLNVIKQITSKLCPSRKYCIRQTMADFSRAVADSFSCCTDCSCEDECWETRTCCPDKEVFYERAPIANCHVSIVKIVTEEAVRDKYNGIYEGVLAYHIIDNCPESEQNISIINKCTLLDIDHIEDYRWVFDHKSKNIYQNKFCAACHGKTKLTEWQLETTCEDLLLSNFSHMHSLLLSDRCDIRNREPGDDLIPHHKRCIIPYFTQCNQSGQWPRYDPDIVWACNAYDAVYMVSNDQRHPIYKNAFCYVCNQQGIDNAPTACLPASAPDRHSIRFGAFIDTKRVSNFMSKQPSAETVCEMNEIMDPYFQKCRILMCPFGSAPFFGNCEQLAESTHCLTVETIYTVTALWSRKDYLFTDNITALMNLGTKMLLELRSQYGCNETGVCCPSCFQALTFVKDIYQSNSSQDPLSNYKAEAYTTYNISSEPNLIFYFLPYTERKCQLPNLLENAVKLAGSVIEIIENGKTEMLLQVDLAKENVKSLMKGAALIALDSRGLTCHVTYTLTKDTICPTIRMNFADFEPFVTARNKDRINSMFSEAQRHSKESVEICIDDYFEKFSRVTISNGSVKLCLEGVIIIVLSQLLSW